MLCINNQAALFKIHINLRRRIIQGIGFSLEEKSNKISIGSLIISFLCSIRLPISCIKMQGSETFLKKLNRSIVSERSEGELNNNGSKTT